MSFEAAELQQSPITMEMYVRLLQRAISSISAGSLSLIKEDHTQAAISKLLLQEVPANLQLHFAELIAVDEKLRKRVEINQVCNQGFLHVGSCACRAACENNPHCAYAGKLDSCWKTLYNNRVFKTPSFRPHQID